MIANLVLGGLAVLSWALTLWQWLVGRGFPLHQRMAGAPAPGSPPPVTLLKPLKGCDAETERCLRSWLTQAYGGPVQVLFGVAEAEDPVRGVVLKLLGEFPGWDAQLIVCGAALGANAKVSQLVELERLAKHDVIVISDADVYAPGDLLANVVPQLHQPQVGLVNCFYRLANPATVAMQWEAVAINADFWSQVLQSRSLKPMDFALGAVMATRRRLLGEIGGFNALAYCLADDYLVGKRLARRGCRIELSTLVVDCLSAPMGWTTVWKHQLRWARTIRVCQPLPYFFSILSNALLWPLAWLLATPSAPAGLFFLCCLVTRILAGLDLQRRLAGTKAAFRTGWFVPLKDLLQIGIWISAFLGNRVEWRGRRLRLRRDGTLAPD